jgi:hypothetical protein
VDTHLEVASWLAIALAAFVVLVVMVRAWLRSARVHARSARAYAGEKEAASILRARGYAILGAQVVTEYPVQIDGVTIAMGLRADYLVSKNGARFIAEVKTGTHAPRIDTASTRRQLLEYELAFDVDGVLLVNADTERIHTIAFPTLGRR